MSRFAVDHLSPLAARRRLDEVDLEEKSRLAEALALIALMDARGDYLEAGYSCMQRYCMEHMHMSEKQAQRRIRVARLGRAIPLVFERIADGRLSFTNACELASVLSHENAERLLDAATHQPKWQVRRIAFDARRTPTAAPASADGCEEQRDCALASSDCAPSLADLCDVPAHDRPLTEASLARVNRQVRGRVFDTAEGARGISVVLTDEEFAAFQQAQDLLAHVVRNGDPAVVVARALAHYATHLHKQRFGAKKGAAAPKRVPRGRNIPAALRHQVAERDEYCCAFVSADGHRCGETRGLQLDHVTPLALGGETSEENLRLLCPRHNRFEASRRLGAEHVATQTELNERARAKQREAKKREAGRQPEPEPAGEEQAGSATAESEEARPISAEQALARAESDADVISALRRLGRTHEQALLGVRRTVKLADGPVEARVLEAIRLGGQAVGRKQGFRPPAATPANQTQLGVSDTAMCMAGV